MDHVIAASRDRGLLVNADTGEPIRWARWANLATGEFEAFAIDPRLARERRLPLAQVVYRGRGRLRWVPTVLLPAPEPALVEQLQAPSSLPAWGRPERCLVLEGRSCQHYGCARLAEWKVSDEEERPPEVGGDGRPYERAEFVAARFYCSWHYRPPRLLDGRGDIILERDEVKVRPQ